MLKKHKSQKSMKKSSASVTIEPMKDIKDTRYADFKLRLNVCFSKWIMRALVERSNGHKAMSAHLKNLMKV